MDIIEAIQENVNLIAKAHFKESEEVCAPQFIVSLLQNNKIMLTCKHRSIAFSEIIFPVEFDDKDEWLYGLTDLEAHMKNLYNRTM